MTRICTKCGVPQEIDQFMQKRKGIPPTTCKICKKCRTKTSIEWNQKNREKIREYKKWIPDDDPETDLVPMTEGGFVRWAVLTDERRWALGEQSSFNGLSVARWRTVKGRE